MAVGSSSVSIGFNGTPAWGQYVTLPQGTPGSGYSLWLYYDGYMLTVDGAIRGIYWQSVQLMMGELVSVVCGSSEGANKV
jgi:hypothetical protein